MAASTLITGFLLTRAGSSIISRGLAKKLQLEPSWTISVLSPPQAPKDLLVKSVVISRWLVASFHLVSIVSLLVVNFTFFNIGVSQPYFLFHRGGTCTTVGSDESDNVLYRAEYLLENGFGEYNLVRNNCEDFARYCKTGKEGMWVRSGQVSHVVAALEAAVPLGLGGVIVALDASMRAKFAAMRAKFAALGEALPSVSTPLDFILLPIGICATASVLTFIVYKIHSDRGEPVPPMSDEWSWRIHEQMTKRSDEWWERSNEWMREMSDRHMREMSDRHREMLDRQMRENWEMLDRQRQMLDDEWMRGHR